MGKSTRLVTAVALVAAVGLTAGCSHEAAPADEAKSQAASVTDPAAALTGSVEDFSRDVEQRYANMQELFNPGFDMNTLAKMAKAHGLQTKMRIRMGEYIDFAATQGGYCVTGEVQHVAVVDPEATKAESRRGEDITTSLDVTTTSDPLPGVADDIPVGECQSA